MGKCSVCKAVAPTIQDITSLETGLVVDIVVVVVVMVIAIAIVVVVVVVVVLVVVNVTVAVAIVLSVTSNEPVVGGKGARA